jgi:hypothetical protein
MKRLFYDFASSSKDKAIIDDSLIKQALDWWTWAWICLECALVFACSSAIAFFFASYLAAFLMLVVGNALTGISLVIIRKSCASTARAEVRSILDDQTRISTLREKLNALPP